MAFDVGAAKGRAVRPAMNVTPLVDVVLVLLIIFMVITPLLAKRFTLHVPPKEDPAAAAPPPSDAPPPVVLTVAKDGALAINSEAIAAADLPVKIQRALAAQAEPVLFFDAGDDVPYGAAMDALDLARSAGAVTIAVLPEKVVVE